ncbi:MAG: tetratricopeptide repeat protein [Gammaproteobacteria bacterium]|nr:tetratricopeptide repeat protein [Gammaproteobacteria bacterium]
MRCWFYSIIACIALLNGCASDDVELQPTIASLQDRVVELNPGVSFEIEPQQVIESYHALMEITADGTYDGDVLRRLSDLELEASLDSRLSEDVHQQQKAEHKALSAVEGYQAYLKQNPMGKDNDMILYQLSRAYALESKPAQALDAQNQLVLKYPQSRYIDEVQFRRGESLFVMRQYAAAEDAYAVVVKQHSDSLFYEKALYKYGWTQLKQNRNRDALDSFIALLDLNAHSGRIEQINLNKNLSRADHELLDDVVRVVSLAFSYQAENESMSKYFKRVGSRDYEPMLYQNLAELYLGKERIADAADTYLAYGKQYPFSGYTSEFHQKAIDIFLTAGYKDHVLEQKIAFVNRYDVGTDFWKQQSPKSITTLQPMLAKHLRELATHFHAQARVSKKPRDYQVSAKWYRRFLTSFPTDKDAPEMNFLLAESLFDSRQFENAIFEYEKTAYSYAPHKNSAEAGYAALLSYSSLAKVSSKTRNEQLPVKRIGSVLRFVETFPQDKRVPAVLLNAAEYFFTEKQYDRASVAAYQLTENQSADKKTMQSAWAIVAHSQYATRQYPLAERSYLSLLPFLPRKSKQTTEVRELIAACIYKQGEIARAANKHLIAAQHFSRLGQVIPESTKRIAAEYDAATAYIELQDWPRSISLLEEFRKRYPKQKKLQSGVSEKLALAYSENGNQTKAAREMIALSANAPQARKRELLWVAAGLYEEAGNRQQALEVYKTYVKAYPLPLNRSIELRHRIAVYYDEKKDIKTRNYWLNEIVIADARGKNQRSDRSRYLAATASMELLKPLHRSYQKTKLTIPLKKSLKKKKKLMQQSIAAYSKALEYQIAEVSTEATYQIAEIYHGFARALLESQRPKGLNVEELEEYDLLLEEQAYPFEEKTIDIHLANFKRIPAGVYDQPVRNSLEVLGELMPFRYAKVEKMEAYVELP